MSYCFYTPLPRDLLFEVDLQVCPYVQIEFQSNSRSFHAGVPVHINGVQVHFCYCQFSAQVYWYTFRVYRYTLPTVTFLARCTYTFKVYRYTLPTGAFLALLEFLRLHQSFAHILSDSFWLPGHKYLYTYALDLKDLHKPKNTKAIKSTYPMPNVGKV